MKKAKGKSRRRSLVTAADALVRRWDGKLTQELVLHPGDFGLGKVPKRLIPDDATDVVCGFCSTGCSLRVHLKDGQAINLSPTSEYPVNLGMACPKGWEALTPLRSPDRATTPMLRNQSGTLEPVDWDTALQIFTLRFKAIQDQFGSDSVAWLGTGQICTEELAFLGLQFGHFGRAKAGEIRKFSLVEIFCWSRKVGTCNDFRKWSHYTFRAVS